MERAAKTTAVLRVAETLRAAPHVIVTDFQGLTANQASELRRRIRKAGGAYRVVKNRLAKRAALGTPSEKLAAYLVGPRGVASHASDPVALAKVLTEFAKDNPQLRVIAALVDAREVVSVDAVKALATLPALPELRAQLLALVATPSSLLVRLLATPAGQLARVLDRRREKLGASD